MKNMLKKNLSTQHISIFNLGKSKVLSSRFEVWSRRIVVFLMTNAVINSANNMGLKLQNQKICFVAPTFRLEADCRFAPKQCLALLKEGAEVSYYVQSNRTEDFNGVNIIPVKREKSKFKQTLVSWKILTNLLRQRCDAYHLTTAEILPIALILKFITKRRVIFDFHEDYVEFIRLKPYLNGPLKYLAVGLTRLLVWLVCKSMDGLVFGDEAVEESYPPMCPERRVLVHHFPMLAMYPDNLVPFIKRRYDVVHIGILSELKGAFEMLEAVRLLRERCGKIRVLFVGEPVKYIKEKFYKYINAHHLDDSLEITGRVPYEKVSKLLDQCKVGLIGLHDTLKFRRQSSTKLFEYMAKGIPCVSVDLPPERRFMNSGEHGYLVPPQNPQAMAEAVHKIISDPQLGEEMAVRTREHFLSSKYYAEHEFDDLVNFYYHILTHPGRRLFGKKQRA